MEKVKCLILGGGPAGFTAAIYAARANLSPVVYEGIQPGGQLTTTTIVENFPGFPGGVDANTLMDKMREQAKSFGADVRSGTATAADLSHRPFQVVIDGETQIEAQTLIIATGAQARYLGLPSEEKFKGAGVSACATCDGFFYRKRTVAVVGGGDTACEDALYLASLAKKVYMIVRRDVFRASKIMQEKVFSTPNIEVLWNCNTQEVLGDEMGVTGARLLRKDGSVFDIVFPGHRPYTRLGALRPLSGKGCGRVHCHQARQFGNRRTGCFRRRRRAGPALPPGHYGRRIGLHGRPRRRKIPFGAITIER